MLVNLLPAHARVCEIHRRHPNRFRPHSQIRRLVYLVAFVRNAYLWTKNRNVKPDVYVPFAQLDRMDFYMDRPSQFQASSYGYPKVRPGQQIYYKE